MNATDYFPLCRKLHFNLLWTAEKFTRGQAWVDMLMLTNYKLGIIRVHGVAVEVPRGYLGWSQIKLAERWKWSRGKLSRFVSELQKMDMITVHQKGKLTTLIQITNYEYYNGSVQQTEQQTGQQTDNKQNTNKKENKEKTTTLCPFAEITDLYHRILPTLPKTRLPESIKKQLAARYKNGMGNVAAWENLFNKVSDSAFLMGDNDRGWKADLGWLTNETNMDKVLGGKYEGRDANSKIGRII